MTINPLVVGAGAAVAAGIGIGVGATRIAGNIAKEHPTGSDADTPMSRVVFGAAALSFASAAAGVVALATGRQPLGAALFGAGFGGMVGSIGAGIAISAKHGVGVDTTLERVLDQYDSNGNGQIEMTDRGWFKPSETTRTHTYTTEDSDGDTHWETDYYSIDRLATRADRDEDWIATGAELRATIESYDADGNGRIQGDESDRFEREVGEQRTG